MDDSKHGDCLQNHYYDMRQSAANDGHRDALHASHLVDPDENGSHVAGLPLANDEHRHNSHAPHVEGCLQSHSPAVGWHPANGPGVRNGHPNAPMAKSAWELASLARIWRAPCARVHLVLHRLDATGLDSNSLIQCWFGVCRSPCQLLGHDVAAACGLHSENCCRNSVQQAERRAQRSTPFVACCGIATSCQTLMASSCQIACGSDALSAGVLNEARLQVCGCFANSPPTMVGS